MKITTFSEVTIDGRLTLGRGASSKALFDFYGPELRHWFHAERAAHHAIMVGAGTVRTDDPELTVRHAPGRNPLRVVPTNDGSLPPQSRILTDGLPTLLAVPQGLPAPVRARLTACPGVALMDCGATRVDLHLMVAALSARGIASLMVEGGSRLLHGFFAAGLVNRIVIKHIPVVSGSLDAPAFFAAAPAAPAVELSRWQVVDWRLIGGVGVSIYEPLKGILA